MTAVQAGIGREAAHEVIKKHAVAEALRMREGHQPQLAQQLAEDPLFKERGITEAKLNGLLQDRTHFIGNAQRQVSIVNAKAQPLLIKYHQEAQYEPKPIV
jgi:adenylosuccinate lyase